MFIFICCFLAGAFAGMDASLFSVLLPQIALDLTGSISQVATLGSTIMSTFLVGWMVGGISLGFASDYFGRVKTLAFSIALYAISTFLMGRGETVEQLAACRFITGLGVGGTMVGIAVFLSETWSIKSRAVAIGVLIASYQVGVFLSGLVAHLFIDWRVAYSFGLLPIILSILVISFFHEPLKVKKENCPAREFSKKNLFLGSLIFGFLLIGYWATSSWIPTWILDISRENGVTRKNMATMLQGIFAILGCVLAGPTVDNFGRRKTLFFVLVAAFLISFNLFWFHTVFSTWIYLWNSCLGFFLGMAQAVMYIYLPELFPRRARASCVGFTLNAGRFVTAGAVLLMGSLVMNLGGYAGALSLFSSAFLVAAFFVLFTPEEEKEMDFSR